CVQPLSSRVRCQWRSGCAAGPAARAHEPVDLGAHLTLAGSRGRRRYFARRQIAVLRCCASLLRSPHLHYPRRTMTQKQTPPALGMSLSPVNPEYQKDPFTLLDEVREQGRAVYDEMFGRYIVSRFEDVQAILNDRDLNVDPRKADES